VHLKVIVEGGEENGKEALGTHVAANPDWFADVDVVVVADTGPWVAGDPAITTSLRGDCDVTVEVRTLQSALHSGDFGGPVPDALTVLARVLATLHDDAGDLAVRGRMGGHATRRRALPPLRGAAAGRRPDRHRHALIPALD
jgi:cysteinylglycine-S-conjugate dipeptidase